jgi:hypothetical protein
LVVKISFCELGPGKKKGFYWDVFKAVEDLKFNMEIGRQFYRPGDCIQNK